MYENKDVNVKIKITVMVKTVLFFLKKKRIMLRPREVVKLE